MSKFKKRDCTDDISIWGKCRPDVDSYQKTEYEYLFFWELKQILTSQFIIDGVENKYLSSLATTYYPYKYGACVFFVDDVTRELSCLPCSVHHWTRGLQPAVVSVDNTSEMADNLPMRFCLTIDKDDFFVMGDNITFSRTKIPLIPLINQLVELSVTIDVNMAVQRTPYILTSNMDERLTAENVFQDIRKGLKVIDLKGKRGKDKLSEFSKFGMNDENMLRVLNLNAPYLIDKLEIERTNLWHNVLEKVGYKVNVNSTKKERLISDEVQGNYEETMGFYYSRKRTRLKAVEWLKAHGFPNARLVECTEYEGKAVGEDGKIHNDTPGFLRESVADKPPGRHALES